MTTTTSDLAELQARIEHLERIRFARSAPTAATDDDDDSPDRVVVTVDDSMRRARAAVERAGLYSARWRWVPAPYYTWTLPERARELGASSTLQLCKSLLLDNKKCRVSQADNVDDPTYPKFVLVVIQYGATLDVKKLTATIRARRPVPTRYDVGRFDFRIASAEDNDRVTGYAHNSVTPFGLVTHGTVPVVLAQAIAELPQRFFWMGGGHVHLKLGVSVTDFQRALQPIVADISQERVGDTSVADMMEG
jgi:prolyl-tRNA editing enzyme YbaK/EbsC (Cys-tRNA(Pro) deacylase)